MTRNYKSWADEKPAELEAGRVLMWRTAHIKLGLQFEMSGPLRRMHNGWTGESRNLPPMTRWDGYKHLIPAGLEWSEDVPEWVEREAAFEHRDRYGSIERGVTQYKLTRLIAVEGIDLLSCPFTGKEARWQSSGGFIGSMPHQDEMFSIQGALETGRYYDPRKAAAFWNARHSEAA